MRIVRTRTTKHHSLALYDAGGRFILEAWDLNTDERRTLETVDYQGHADRIATRSMMLGALASCWALSREGAL